MKVKNVNFACRREKVYDFETPSHAYVLKNGCISHNTMELYSKDIVSGGTGVMYSSDNVYILGRQQDKTGTDLNGYNFIINVEKSRFVREKSKIPLSVSFENGISRWSGLLELSLDFGFVTKPKLGWYTRRDVANDKNWREKDTNTSEFWNPILEDPAFDDACKKRYRLGDGAMMQGDHNPNTDTPELDEED